MTSRAITLPCPNVRFDALFLARVERLSARLAAARTRREGAGSSALAGGGDDFVGHRPYQRGEDLRQLDWSLLARLDRPFVRVLRRAAGERWIVALDASASMGVGPPGKLQRAAEISAAIATLGLALGAETRVHAGTSARGSTSDRSSVRAEAATPDEDGTSADESSPGRAPTSAGVLWPARESSFRLARRSRLADLLRFLEGLGAQGVFDLSSLVHERELAGAARLFVVGDLLGTPRTDLVRLASARRATYAIQLLAPHELAPDAIGAVEWVDPESGASLARAVDDEARSAYEIELARELETWGALLAAHRIAYGCFSTEIAFEDVLRRLRIA